MEVTIKGSGRSPDILRGITITRNHISFRGNQNTVQIDSTLSRNVAFTEIGYITRESH
jgi:hypothetical protein